MLNAESDMDTFKLHPNLSSKDFITELKLCLVLFEDNKNFPWIFLVPKRNVKNMLGLTTEERLDLMREIEVCEKAMFKIFKPDQTNIAMLGNKTPALHVHIICRKEGDINWPDSPFSAPVIKYTSEEKLEVIEKIKKSVLGGI